MELSLYKTVHVKYTYSLLVRTFFVFVSHDSLLDAPHYVFEQNIDVPGGLSFGLKDHNEEHR